MQFGFHVTEHSKQRNLLTSKYEPIQPFILYAMMEKLGSTHFFDIGANVGYYSFLACHLPSLKSVFSFEALPDTFQELVSNIEMNLMRDKIFAINEAVSDNDGQVKFAVEAPLSGINCIQSTSPHRSSLFPSAINVKCSKLDTFSSLFGSLISLKIDVEGHESQVLDGAMHLLSSNKCIIQVESFPGNASVIEDLLFRAGYRLIFSVCSDRYFSNANKFFADRIVLECLEAAGSLMVQHSLKQWPPVISNLLTVSVELDNGVLKASSFANPMLFDGHFEYAFYLFVNGNRKVVEWYSTNSTYIYSTSEEAHDAQFRVTAFIRDSRYHSRVVSCKSDVVHLYKNK